MTDVRSRHQDLSSLTSEAVICGAGLAGISAAYYLAAKHGIRDLILVDERPPLTLTSDKSTECYRNWWPGPGDTMVRFMNRSIDLLERLADESDNLFGLNRRGYIFLTADKGQAENYMKTAQEISSLGAGPIRIHRPGRSTYRPSPPEGFKDMPTGADILLGTDLIREHYPFITKDVVAMLHPRRCGWLSAQQLGMYMLEKAKARGVRLLTGRISAVSVSGNRVESVQVNTADGPLRIKTQRFIIAAGPLLKKVGAMLDLDLPVFNELHGKIAFIDREQVLPRDLPLTIWSDPVRLPWSNEERAEIAADEEINWLLEEFPAGVHFRPEGLGHSQVLLILWTYDVEIREPIFPPEFDSTYPEIVLRGLSRMVPAMSIYFNHMGKPVVDGGYYCKTRENRPLIGPLPVEGAYVIGALSGFGVMACQAAGELLAAHVAGTSLPDYAPAFLLERYDDPIYQTLLAQSDATSGQL